MIIKIEAIKGNYATFDQVFEDSELAFDKFEELTDAGWTVEWINLPISKGEYFDKLNAELMMDISDIFQGVDDGKLKH